MISNTKLLLCVNEGLMNFQDGIKNNNEIVQKKK